MGAAGEGVVALASGGGQEEVFDSEELALKKNLHRRMPEGETLTVSCPPNAVIGSYWRRNMRYLLMTGVLACAAFAQDFKLPPPFATPSARNNSHVIERPAGAQLKVPAGFTVEEYMSGFAHPAQDDFGAFERTADRG